ncbi:MAG: type II toxin-antitoxin system HipA family toxin YjjJ [Sulfuricellaceae bacterium]
MANSETLLDALRSGPLSAADLYQRLGVSQPTLSRWARGCGATILRLGQARQSRYFRRREIGGVSRYALYRVTQAGLLEQWGMLNPVMAQGYVVEHPTQPRLEYFEGLPWYMQDMRPQGFLGRAFARRHAARLGLPEEVNLWSDDQTLRALAALGDDCVGDLLVGEEAASAFLAQPAPAALAPLLRPSAYPRLAALALAGETAGSSAGGEQPKFTANVLHNGAAAPVLVKFSAPDDNAGSARWRSLLVCEHLALQILGEAGLPVSRSELVMAGNQVFLELQRFDRIGARGRIGIVSLKSLDDAFVGLTANWPRTTETLLRGKHITAAAHDQTQRLYAFGALIGNSDMHFGNLSFLHDGVRPLSLAPAYDMLPMHFAPRSSGHIPTDLPPLNLKTDPPLPVWRAMLPLAHDYWQRVADHPLIGDEFRGIADGMRGRVGEMMTRV